MKIGRLGHIQTEGQKRALVEYDVDVSLEAN